VDGKFAPWESAEKIVGDKLAALVRGKQGGKIAVVTGLETGSLARLLDEWVKALGARPRVAYEPLGLEAIRAANRASFGRDAIPEYAIEEAGYLVSFGADFLETWLSPVGHAAAFAKMHALSAGKAGTFGVSRGCPTAANADQWLQRAGPEGRWPRHAQGDRRGAGGARRRCARPAARQDRRAAIATVGVRRHHQARGPRPRRVRAGLGGGAAVSGSNATDCCRR
jgi:hypothetical protein